MSEPMGPERAMRKLDALRRKAQELGGQRVEIRFDPKTLEELRETYIRPLHEALKTFGASREEQPMSETSGKRVVFEGRMRGFPSAQTLEDTEGQYGRAHARAEFLQDDGRGSFYVDTLSDLAEMVVREFDSGDDPLKWAGYRDLGNLRVTVERLKP